MGFLGLIDRMLIFDRFPHIGAEKKEKDSKKMANTADSRFSICCDTPIFLVSPWGCAIAIGGVLRYREELHGISTFSANCQRSVMGRYNTVLSLR